MKMRMEMWILMGLMRLMRQVSYFKENQDEDGNCDGENLGWSQISCSDGNEVEDGHCDGVDETGFIL